MAQAQIATYISKLDTLDATEIASLTQEIALTPWCATYRMLLAKAYANQGSYQKNKSLRIAATYAGSREQLFELMHTGQVVSAPVSTESVVKQETYIETPVAETEVVATEEKAEKLNETQEEVFAEVKETKTVEQIAEPEEIEAEPNIVLEKTEYIEEESTAQIEDVLPEAIEPVKLDAEAELQDMSEETSDQKPSSKQLKEVIDFEKIVQYDPLKELPALEKHKEKKRVEIPFDRVIYNPEKELNKLIAQKEEPENKEKDFLFWLNNVEDAAAPKPKKDNFKSPDKVQDLLDQFLATKRTRPIHNGTFYNVNTRAEQSEHDNMDVLSETLVELYVKQNHIEKAIKGYTKLSLQNPEKSAYFAARIKELEQQQKEL